MVIYVKSFKVFLKTFVISGWCLAIFIGAGYYYVKSQTTPAENEVESVPYYDYIPENKGVLLSLGTRCVYFYLDFELSSVTVMLNPENPENKGYNADYIIEGDYSIISNIADYFEGINLDIEGEILRYTGGQVVDLLSKDNSDILREKIIAGVFSKMFEEGVAIDFFNNIIKNSKTNLKLPDCYFWKDKMDDIAKNVRFLNA